ncbi:CHRD domain-containing protein [Methylobacterium nigriterrae]|uniref:CHRD domain-containing protein n=1 Tax=Methylobacterium nigriterrae TaxID=3127512 RepID=UPI00301379C6
MIHAVRTGLVVLGLACCTLSGADAAGTATYRASLNGQSEVPANAATGTGEVTLTYDPAGRELSWKGSYSGLTGPVTAAHFHGPAEAGANAGVLIPVTASSSPFSGSATLDEAKAADLAAGKLYFNIHTGANPKGEIRGQVVKAP